MKQGYLSSNLRKTKWSKLFEDNIYYHLTLLLWFHKSTEPALFPGL